MSNEIIKHDAELNTIPLRRFTSTEMNLFFSIVSRMRDKGGDKVRFDFDQLKDLSAYKATANTRFIDDLEHTYDQLMELRFGRRSKSGLRRERFVMFTAFDINGDAPDPYVEIQVHEKAIPLLNHLDRWVRYSLAEFRDLNSSYAKTMFRLLKQWRTKGRLELSKGDFTELLDVPSSYQQSDIDKRILKPIKEELSPLFPGLKVTKRRGKGRGKPIIGYTFTWKPEAKDANDFSRGAQVDRAKKLDNIHHNASLTTDEKEAAVRRVVGLFDELPQWLREEKRLASAPKKLEGAELETLKAVNAKIALTITRVTQLIADGQKLTAGDKKKLAQLNELYASNAQRIAAAEA
ncbi:replication initiation protein [Lacticaseibacillus suibinensis]|uniref:replication initiation protein n=1 Tax=Lacticaseibacillus suibinensis TaxID=2486011 RepID=UPI000F784DAD|nr:replication initiation protein [Lacticaseibacillus suibinensis]